MNYDELGFKCGIEIHQQLATGSKLFCECPVETENESADAKVERYLKSVEGETGESDEAAEMESARGRKFIYNYYDRCNCLVELDEEPPHSMNEEALDAALTFARMVDAELPAEIQVMRKMVVDGSNTSGFQRTAMVGLNGSIDTESGRVSIEDIELEEESAGIHTREEHSAVYDLDRLGIPLVEVGTDASIQSPEHAREVAERIGMLLRSTNRARRGLGTIRQDVNVSIEEGSRVEIKGFQDVENIDRVIELEVERQRNLVGLGKEMEDREVLGDNVTHVFEEAENEIVSTVVENEGSVYAVVIPGMAGEMKRKISGERYVAKELVDYARSRGLNGIIHTDEDLDDYGLGDEFAELGDIFDTSEEDAVVVLAGPEEKAREAAKAVRDRAQQLLRGEVPEETRSAEQDFTTSYSRPLPGAARMYPETDVPPIRIPEGKVEEIGSELPDTLEERREQYAEEIGEELASQIVSSRRLPFFERYRNQVDPGLAANFFVNYVPAAEAEGAETGELDEKHFDAVFDALESGEASKGDIQLLVEELCKRAGESPRKVVEDALSSRSSEQEIREAVAAVIDENQQMIEDQGKNAQGALMGMVMEKVDADGGTVSRILESELEDRL